MDLCIKYERPILLVGPTGTGKSVYVQQHLMNGLSKETYLPNFVNFSAQTSANQTQVSRGYYHTQWSKLFCMKNKIFILHSLIKIWSFI
jgi:sigma54-dependent transcription regulator